MPRPQKLYFELEWVKYHLDEHPRHFGGHEPVVLDSKELCHV